MILRLKVNKILIIAISFLVNFGFTTELIKKSGAVYHSACGCNNLFYLNKLEGNDIPFNLLNYGDGSVNVTPSELPGSSDCNKIQTKADKFAYLEIDRDLVLCKMRGKYSCLSGYFKTDKGRIFIIRGEYKNVNDDNWTTMEPVLKTGVPFWEKFDYYIDFTQNNRVTYFRFVVSTPDETTPVSIDEIKICSYCDFNDIPGPQLIKLTPSVGELNTPFLPDRPYYTLTVKQPADFVHFTPEIENTYKNDNSVHIFVNNNDVVSGHASQDIEIKDKSTIEVVVEKTKCLRTLYVVTLNVPVPEENNASLFSLKTLEGKLSPVFYKNILSYEIIVNSEISNIDLKPVAISPKATIKINGIQVLTKDEYVSIDITNNKTVNIEVTAGDGITKKTYTCYIVNNKILYVDYGISMQHEAEIWGKSEIGKSWPNAYKYLQDALNAAHSPGSHITEIHVAEGTYYPDETYPDPTGDNVEYPNFSTFNVSNLNIYGGYPAGGGETRNTDPTTNNTVLSGDIDHDQSVNLPDGNAHHVVTGGYGIIDGFVISDGYGAGSCTGELARGGGLFISMSLDNDLQKIQNCKFKNNLAAEYGGGIYAFEGTINIDNCIFENNKGNNKGGAISTEMTKVIVNNSKFISNGYTYNYVPYSGGAIDVSARTLDIIGKCEFIDNQATAGSAINFQGDRLTIDDCNFKENKCKKVEDLTREDGGGVIKSNSSNTSITKCTFDQNEANYADLNYGAIYTATGLNKIENCVFLKNITVGKGGAIYIKNAQSTITNCTFYGNKSADGAVYNDNSSNSRIRNSIFWKNKDQNDLTGNDIKKATGAEITVINCDVEQGITGNKNVDPMFKSNNPANPDVDLQLRIGSQCLNPENSEDAPPEDRLGIRRNFNLPDWGAYENIE